MSCFIYIQIYIFASVKSKISYLNEKQLKKTASTIKAIAHPLRIKILQLLKQQERMSVTEIYEELEIEQAVASLHLNLLKKKGILTGEKEGKNCYYSLKNDIFFTMLDCMERCGRAQ